MNDFEVACGSVVGKDHISTGKVLIGRNNQDAYAVRQTNDLTVAVVCDGCGSGKHSEVGAWLGANMLATTIYDRWQRRWSDCAIGWRARALEQIRLDVLARIRLQADSMTEFDGSFSRVINDYFLFTVVGVVIDRGRVTIFHVGDGGYAVNWMSSLSSGFKMLGPFEDNAPPYLAYDLVESSINPAHLKFCMSFYYIHDVGSVVIGSDGVGDLLASENKLIPGAKEEVGPFEQFWKNDVYFENPDATGRQLRRMNSDVVRIDKATSRRIVFTRLLPDDTTLVVVRRKCLDQSQ